MLKLDDGTDERSQSGWWMVRDCWWRLMNGVVGDRKFSERGKIPCSGAHNSGEETSRSGSLLGVKRQWTVQSPPDCDVSATFMRNRREFDVKLEKINLTRCYEVRLMTVAMVTAVTLQPPRLKRLSPSLKKEW